MMKKSALVSDTPNVELGELYCITGTVGIGVVVQLTVSWNCNEACR